MKVHEDDEFGFWSNSPLGLTLDQLITFSYAHREGSPARVADILNRQQSTVERQLISVAKHFESLTDGSPLFKPRRERGQALEFSYAGEEVAQLADAVLATWRERLIGLDRCLHHTLRIGATSFTLEYLPERWYDLLSDLAHRGIDVSVLQVRTEDLTQSLAAKKVDAVLGGIVLKRDASLPLGEPFRDFDVLPYHREQFIVLASKSLRDLPTTISWADLKDLPMIVPQAGLIHKFLGMWYGSDFRSSLQNVLPVDGDINFCLGVAKSSTYPAVMVVPASVQHSRFADSQFIVALPLMGDSEHPPLDAVAALIVNKGDLAHVHEEDADIDAAVPPIQVIWNYITENRNGIVAADPFDE